MSYDLFYGTVRESRRNAIYVVRVHGTILTLEEVDDITARMRERLQNRGELASDVVVLQGHNKMTFRLFGNPYSVSRVRAALFNAAVSWTPIELT